MAEWPVVSRLTRVRVPPLTPNHTHVNAIGGVFHGDVCEDQT